MIIELVGLPGSGKTTLARSLAQEAGYSVVRVKSARDMLWLNLIFFLKYPVTALRLTFLVLGHLGSPKLWRYKIISILLDYNARYIRASQLEKAIIDQGHSQILLSLFDAPVSSHQIQRIHAWLPKPDHYVVFTTDEAVRQQRVAKRPYRHRSMMSEDERKRWQETVTGHFRWLREVVQQNSFVPVHTTNGEDTREIHEYFTKPSLYYIVAGRMPTEKAYGNQIAMMVTEFTKLGRRVEVWFPQRQNNISATVSEYYKIPVYIAERTVSALEITAHRAWYPRIAFYLEQISFLWKLYRTRVAADATVYTRRPEVAWLFKNRVAEVICEFHEWSDTTAWWWVWLVKRKVRLVTTNRFIKAEFVQRGIAPERIIIAPNGVSLEQFTSTQSKAEAYQKLQETEALPAQLKVNSTVLLYAGNFKTMGEDKGITDILKAMKLLPESIFFIAIGGTDADRDYYETEAIAHGVAKQCLFMGRVTKEKMLQFGRYADILMMPFPKRAHYEFFMSPLKTFEYMAIGRPILTTTLPSIQEILTEETAFFVPPDAPTKIAEMVEKIIADPYQAEQTAAHARQAVNEYTWKNRALKILSEYAT